MRPPHPSPRVEDLIGRAYRVLLMLYLALGVPFVFGYRSEGAEYGPYTGRYLFGVLIPFVAVTLLALGGALAHDALSGLLSRTLGRAALPVAGAGFWAAGLASILYAMRISDEYVSILMLLALPCVLLYFWDAARRSVNAQLAGLPVLIGGVVLFGIELAGPTAGPLAVWGDTSTFAMIFPREAPFTGSGGRLRPGLDVRMRAPEYRTGARLITNSAGFRNTEEFDGPPAADELRLLSLGDSFSIGFGADQDAFFGSLLERELSAARPSQQVRVMNAEISDPAYGLRYLQRHGMRFEPSIVIYGLSGNDIMQAEQFYGPDRLFRLTPEGRLEANPDFDPGVGSAWSRFQDFAYPVVGRKAPRPPRPIADLLTKAVRFRLLSGLAEAAARAGERAVPMPGYASEFERTDGRLRLVDGAANLAFFYRPGGAPVERMYAAFFDLLLAMERTARGGGARFLLVLHPFRYQVQPADWDAMKTRWNLREEDFDLTLYNRRIAEFCMRHGIALCDLREAFAEAAGEGGLYLPRGDTHYNRRGHRVAAGAAGACVARLW